MVAGKTVHARRMPEIAATAVARRTLACDHAACQHDAPMDLTLFALDASRAFGERVAHCLAVPLAAHEERIYEDGEHKLRSLETVRGRDVYVVQSLHADAGLSVDDKLVRLLFFIGALKDASARRVTAVMPYLCYARKDRRTKARDPVATRYVAALLEAVGTDAVITLDVHNLSAFQNAFRIPSDQLVATNLFVEHFAPLLDERPVTVVSPDIGGVKRAETFRMALASRLGRPVGMAFMEKHRGDGAVSGELFFGDVESSDVILIDDMVSTGGTLRRAVSASRARGARRVFAAASHGLFTEGASGLVDDPALDGIVVTDSIAMHRLDLQQAGDRVQVLGCAPLFAQAIGRMHDGGSLLGLTGDETSPPP
jgi:ribose-phosphate pyrophosphokinase